MERKEQSCSSQQLFHIESPLLESPALSVITGVPIYLKMDALQPSGSFKIRGIGYHCTKAVRERGCTRLVSSSGGNAGLAVAYSGRRLGVPVTVVVPSSTSELIKKKLEMNGAEVLVHGDHWAEAHQKAQEIASSPDVALIHPFDHPEIWEGHESIIIEAKKQLPSKPSAVVCSVGGGGLLIGVVHGLRRVGWDDVPVITVETEGAESFALSVKANELITLPGITSIAKTLGATRVSEQAFQCSKEHKIISKVVTDSEAVDALCRFADDHRCLVEPACAASLAVLYNSKKYLSDLDLQNGVLAIVCGGSGVSLDMISQWRSELL